VVARGKVESVDRRLEVGVMLGTIKV